jgi:hypothetical protein
MRNRLRRLEKATGELGAFPIIDSSTTTRTAQGNCGNCGKCKEYEDNRGSAITCLYSIAGRTGSGQAAAICARDVSRVRHSDLAGCEIFNHLKKEK